MAALSPSIHTPQQERRYVVVLVVVAVLLGSVFPVLARSSYTGSEDLHVAIETIGALLGLIAGFALVMRFRTLGNRFHLVIGLAFFVNGAEDLAHGLLSFHSVYVFTGAPTSSLAQFIPGTYVTGRLILGVVLLIAPFARIWFKESERPKLETIWGSSAAVVLTLVATVIAFRIRLPQFIYSERFISRPADFMSAIVLILALAAFLWEYHRSRDMLTWWISLSIGVNLVGQLMMSFSKALYDPFFDIAHLYKVLGYAAPLLGFSLYQTAVITERKQQEQELRRHRDRLEELVAERAAELLKANEELQQEIGERRRAEADQKRLIAIMESTSDLISTARPDTGVTYMNSAGRALVGWPDDDVDLKDKRIADVHPNWAASIIRDEGIPTAIRDGVWQGETAVLIPGGTEIPVSQVIMSHKSPTGELEYLSTIMRDITERKKMEEALKRHTELLERLNADLKVRNRELDEFTYVASHDLQEPLHKLSAFCDLLREDIQKGEREEVDRDLQVLSSAAQRMRRLVQDLLALSRSGRQNMNWEEVDIDEIVNVALDSLAIRVEETGAQIVRRELPVLQGDKSLLTQLYQNLIGNALKFRGEASPRIELSAENVRGRWILGVADNGIGLKPEHAERIFVPFERLHERGEYEGTGIGLAICRKIVQRHAGRIWVESEPGKGAHFRFTIGELERRDPQ
jgi:PAS domain S-box-containing protein